MSTDQWKAEPANKALYWWWDLQDLRDGQPNPLADRAARARLRRADMNDALMDEAVSALYRRMFGSAYVEGNLRKTARVALVLAHVREDAKGKRLGALFGEGGDDARRFKPLRFKRLLLARTDEEIITEFRRAVQILGKSAPVRELANTLLNWEDDATRTRLAFDYFGARTESDDASRETA